MCDFPREHPYLSKCFMMDVSEIVSNIETNPAVLSWDGADYLRLMHERVDIAAGFLVSHEHSEGEDNTSYLNWHSTLFCQMPFGMMIRLALKKSKLGWLEEATAGFDNNMLATVEINESTVPANHMEHFGERIVNLMKEIGSWCDDCEA